MTCNVWRSRRAHHCKVCGFCMERFDHHCEVMGNCVAKRNHVFFATFLVACQVACGMMLGGVVWRLRSRYFPGDDSLKDGETYVLLVLGIVYGYHVLLLVFGDLHCCAVITDVTTKDCLSDPTLKHNLPCLPGRRNPSALLVAWQVACFGPWRWRNQAVAPYSQQRDLSDPGARGGGVWSAVELT
ncbi:MAG: hypothetical protein WDW36_008532 [Sanguina aurantia]